MRTNKRVQDLSSDTQACVYNFLTHSQPIKGYTILLTESNVKMITNILQTLELKAPMLVKANCYPSIVRSPLIHLLLQIDRWTCLQEGHSANPPIGPGFG